MTAEPPSPSQLHGPLSARLERWLGPSPDADACLLGGGDGPGGWTPLIGRWRDGLAGQALLGAVDARLAAGATVYPAAVFRALAATAAEDVRVVIIGQDPYHGPGQADGLAFSVPDGTPWPPSLRNIWTEVARDLGAKPPPRSQGSLLRWARQGVLLLNTSLTVEDGQPASHSQIGWQALTDDIGRMLWASGRPLVFLLWGSHAQSQAAGWTAGSHAGATHTVLRCNHPSPLAARRPPVPFVGCGHFGLANAALRAAGRPEIDWLAA